MSVPYRCYVLVSREQIAANFRAVRSVVGPGTEVCAVVKADAYGHGALEVSRVVLAEGAKWLAVSSVEEGVTLRRNGITGARILVMGGFLPQEVEALAEFELTVAVHSLEQISQLNWLALKVAQPIRYHLKLDSGMGRLGDTGDVGRHPGRIGEVAGCTPGRADDALRIGLRLLEDADRGAIGLF